MQGIRIFMLYMMMRLTALMTYCWMACVLASCVGSASSDAIEVNLLHTDVDTIAYSAFVDSIEYIPLETTEECLVGEVTDVVMAGDRLFVFDAKQQEVWSFDRSGRYVGRLGRRGEGPGEYLSIAQFEYDHRDSLLAVLTFVGAPCVQYYSPDGTYVKTVKLGMPADDFKLGADGSFILSCAGRDDPSAGIYHADASGGAVRPLMTRKQGQLVYTTFPWELCSYGDVVSFMSPVFDNAVYHWQGDSLRLAYPFWMLPALSREYEETVSLQDMQDYIRSNYVEGERWIYATYWSADRDRGLRVFLYSKADGRHWVARGLKNDMDAVEPGFWTSYTDGNVFVMSQYGEDPDRNPVIQVLHLK